ncbi:MAG: glutamate 5-kinase [Acidimicrobiales bacterium]
MPIVVVKLGSSSVVRPSGDIDTDMLTKLVGEVSEVQASGRQVVVVTSGAIAAGLPQLGWSGPRPSNDSMLRAAAAVGQTSLMRAYESAFATVGLLCGQVLLAPTDFMFRRRYLKSRGTLHALLEAGVVPIVNENDAIADDEIRFGDNDRLGALVAHLVEASRLVLLTDTAGLFTADPRVDESASLIEEIVAIDHEMEAAAGGAGSLQSTGGMASKLAAAKIATWSGVETVIASAHRDRVVIDAINGTAGVGTVFRARDRRLGARKLWIAFALPASGRIIVDAGARRALEERQGSLLPAGIIKVEGTFDVDAAVEVLDDRGEVFAKGQVSWGSGQVEAFSGRRTEELPDHFPDAVIHRDDLVLLPK